MEKLSSKYRFSGLEALARPSRRGFHYNLRAGKSKQNPGLCTFCEQTVPKILFTNHVMAWKMCFSQITSAGGRVRGPYPWVMSAPMGDGYREKITDWRCACAAFYVHPLLGECFWQPSAYKSPLFRAKYTNFVENTVFSYKIHLCTAFS